MNKAVALIVGLLVIIAISGCISSDEASPSASIEMADAEVAAEPNSDKSNTAVDNSVVSEPISSDAAYLAEHYPDNLYNHVVIEKSAFEELNGGDISGYKYTGGSETAGSLVLSTDNPDHAGVQFYHLLDVSRQLGPGATMEFYTPVDNPEVMGAYAEALDKSRIPHVFASVTDSNGKIVYRGPWFSNNAADYSDAAQNGGLNSEIYRVSKELMLLDGVPESYFDVVESKN